MPIVCTGALRADCEKICPIGAPEKYGSVASATASTAAVRDGKLPT
jgi:hypothetical protein